jgi:hypothetical protein
MGVVGSYIEEGRWIEVRCERRGSGYGVLELDHVEGDRPGPMVRREWACYEQARRCAEAYVLSRGGLLGQGARGAAGLRLERRLARTMFGSGLSRWVHLPAGQGPSDPPGEAA